MSVRQVELRLFKLEQLFNPLDPSPLREKDLDTKVEQFIVDWVEDLPRDASLRLVLHLQERDAQVGDGDIEAAVRGHFAACQEREERALRGLLRVGRRSLAIGIAFLVVCNGASGILRASFAGPMSSLLQEGLIILGWVANWRPAEIFLYDWWPIWRRIKLYERLQHVSVKIRPPPASGGAGA